MSNSSFQDYFGLFIGSSGGSMISHGRTDKLFMMVNDIFMLADMIFFDVSTLACRQLAFDRQASKAWEARE